MTGYPAHRVSSPRADIRNTINEIVGGCAAC
jgi:hypothetical protein